MPAPLPRPLPGVGPVVLPRTPERTWRRDGRHGRAFVTADFFTRQAPRVGHGPRGRPAGGPSDARKDPPVLHACGTAMDAADAVAAAANVAAAAAAAAAALWRTSFIRLYAVAAQRS